MIIFYRLPWDNKLIKINNKRASYFEYSIKKPAVSVFNTFIFLVFFGTLLLSLPISNRIEGNISIIDAMFTATSAVCVTGLAVVDTGNDFTLFGQLVILFLIQCGALGIIIFSYIGSFVSGRYLSMQDKFTISFALNVSDMSNLYSALKKIVFFTLFFEAIGIVFLFFSFVPYFGWTINNLFISFFHSISAFCNAGFSLFTDSLTGFNNSVSINLTISFLIIIGGLSFAVLFNIHEYIFDILKVKVFKSKNIIRKLNLNTKIVLLLTVFFLIFGTLLIYATEHANTLKEMPTGYQYLAAFFQSVTSRTAGFNTIDTSRFTNSTFFVIIFLMFIGGASGSTAGGVKVNTFGIAINHILSILKNKNTTVIFKESISKTLVSRSFVVIMLGMSVVFITVFLLSISEKHSPIQYVFEAVSAFGTVGLSAGITSSLSFAGKIMIIVTMFIGRVGLITMLSLLSGMKPDARIEYPESMVSIG